MDVIYPKDGTSIFIPRNLEGSMEKVVFEIAHRQPENLVHWHLDDEFLGSTQSEHRMEILASAGKHRITIIDERGELLAWSFRALEK